MSPHKSLLKKWISVSSKMITLRLGIRPRFLPRGLDEHKRILPKGFN